MPSKGKDGPNSVWQDRDIKFDVNPSLLDLRKAEFLIDRLSRVEDTKGNNGEAGELSITNLRVIWQSNRHAHTNLSIGYNSIVSINIKSASSRLLGNTQALYVMTRFQGSRFEFSFTNLVANSPRLFTTIQAVFRAYDTEPGVPRPETAAAPSSRTRSSSSSPKEEVYNKIGGVWNLSNERGNLGAFHVTNVRLVWHADAAENFNVSIPYVQMKSVPGPREQIRSVPRGQHHQPQWRIHPRLSHRGSRTAPNHLPGDRGALQGVQRQSRLRRGVQRGRTRAEPRERHGEARTGRRHHRGRARGGWRRRAGVAQRGGDGGTGLWVDPVFDETLGLAVEPLPEGMHRDLRCGTSCRGSG